MSSFDPEDADRPRRRYRDEPSARSLVGPLLLAAVGGVVLVGLACVGGMAWWLLRPEPDGPPNNPPAVAAGDKAKPGEPKARPPAGPRPAPADPAAPDVPTIEPRTTFQAGRPDGSVRLRLSADGSRAAVRVQADDRTRGLQVWDLSPTPKLVREFGGSLRDLSADGRRLIRTDATHQLIDVESGTTLTTFFWDGFFLRFAGPDRIVGVGSAPGGMVGEKRPIRVNRFDGETGRSGGSFEISPQGAAVSDPELTADGREVAVGWSDTRRVETWDVASGKRARGTNLAKLDTEGKAAWHRLVVSPDATRAGHDTPRLDRAAVFDLKTGAAVREFPGALGPPVFIPGRPDVVLVVRGSEAVDRFVPPAWSAERVGTGAVVARLSGGTHWPAVSADGRVLVAWDEYQGSNLHVFDLTRIP